MKRCACRVTDRQSLKQRGELLFSKLCEHVVGFTEVFLISSASGILVHIQYQGFEKITLAAVPKMIAFAGTGVADNDIGEYLGHECVSVQVGHAVPGVAVFGVDQIENLHVIPVFSEQFRGIRI